jgi:S-DNA-T family DNA segregation ATPase FtsK/SpoIIIE
MGKAMTEAWKGEVPKRMPVMPENVTAEDMSQAYTVRTYLPFGMAYDKIEPAGLNLEKEYCAMVAGSVGCGKSTLLCRTARMIHDRVENSKIFVFDGSKKSMASVRDIAEGYAAVTDQEQTTAALGSIIEMLNTRKRAQNAAREQQGEGFDEKAYAQSLELACVFIDDVCEYTDTVDKASVDSMERIVRLAEGLGIIVVAAGRTANLIKYSEIERLTRAILAGQKGLALSDSAAAHPYFKNSLKFGEKDAEFGDGNGMLFDGASSRKIKLAR